MEGEDERATSEVSVFDKFQENRLMALFLRLVAGGVICTDHIRSQVE